MVRRSAQAMIGGVWMRAAVLHPVLFVGAPVALSFAVADPSDNGVPGPLAFCFYALPVAALASAVTTLVMALRRPLPAGVRISLVVVGMAGSGAAFVLGFVGWLDAAEIACNGGYECPF